MHKITELFQMRLVYLQEKKIEKVEFIDVIIEKLLRVTNDELDQILANTIVV